MRYRLVPILLLAAATAAGVAPAARGEDDARGRSGESLEAPVATAAVQIDGVDLFQVRGFTSYSPEKRAAAIAEKIEAIAADRTIPPTAVQVVVGTGEALPIKAGDRVLFQVLDADARVEGVSKRVLAEVNAMRIRGAITRYREDRDRPALVRSSLISAATLAGFCLVAALIAWAFRRITRLLEAKYGGLALDPGTQPPGTGRGGHFWRALERMLQVTRSVAILVLGLLALDVVLGLFPWTRPIAENASGMARPIDSLAHALVRAFPNLLFLVVLFFGFRYLLRIVELFFEAIDRKAISLQGFEADWAIPTYKVFRFAIIALAIVMAYPHIPGSNTAAFKGLTVFLGIVLSLGSSSFVANIVAGYSVTYRRAYRIGDRVKIGDVTGDVTELRLQGTHIRTTKNEVVTVPNSEILRSDVVNYSTLAKESGLILHADVGIGYGTPWRQVEAMLLLASERTPELLRQPRPFVRIKALGEFYVTHEINAFCDAPQAMGAIYTALFRQILDVFNENGVQIMTPAYYEDPAVPKVVPKEQWYLAPAAGPP